MKAEHVVIAVLALAIIAVAIFKMAPEAIVEKVMNVAEEPDENRKSKAGPFYLTYNQPWAFCPPNAGVMPDRAISQLGVMTYENHRDAAPQSS